MNELIEISDVYRSNISKRRINIKNKQQKSSLAKQADSICRGRISREYIHTAFQKLSGGFVYYTSDEDTILGICLWKYYKPINTLHILLLCSKDPSYTLGKTIVNDVEYYCFENKIPTITLEPATEELFEYYAKLGFQIDVKNPNQMKKELELMAIHKRNKKTRKISKHSSVNYPLIASTMPINLNIWRHQNY